jgi:hypothetical protein
MPLMMGSLAVCSWLGIMVVWLTSDSQNWEYTHGFEITKSNYRSPEEPQQRIAPQLQSISQSLEEAGFKVWVSQEWAHPSEGEVVHAIRFSNGWNQRISGELKLRIEPHGQHRYERRLMLRMGGPEGERSRIDDLGLRIREILSYG